MLSPERMLQQFGLGLAVAILLDAFLIRCLIVPAAIAAAGRTRLVDAALARAAPAPHRARARPGDGMTRAFATAAAFAAALLDAGCELDEDAGTIQSEERTVATASGRVGALTATLGGVGKLQPVELTAKQAKVRISGIGNATVNVTEDLDAVVTGVGSFESGA